ncbi:MAG TPA: hypothetical protein VEJ63_06430 [Planctomycetota bacterium]|nr:hypothetical protein [Planctomycetota bacterium]
MAESRTVSTDHPSASQMHLRATEVSSTSALPRMPEPRELVPGSLVRRTHPFDGSRRSGHPVGPVLKIAKFYNYGDLSLVEFTDGTHAFAWTLAPVASPETSEVQSA